MSKLLQLAAKIFNSKEEFRPKILTTEKRVRGKLAGEYIFDTTAAKLVWENGSSPVYWVPRSDFRPIAQFTADENVSGIQSSTYRIQVKNSSIPALVVPSSFNSELAGYVKIEHNDLDSWWEEEGEVLYHPKNPFHRVDVIPSSRHIRVDINGTVLADTKNEGLMSLWETSLPGRWYVPASAVKWDYLKPSKTTTGCPYKGEAKYYHAVIDGKTYEDVVWWYENPIYESAQIKGMLCFYPDKVNYLIDGKPL